MDRAQRRHSPGMAPFHSRSPQPASSPIASLFAPPTCLSNSLLERAVQAQHALHPRPHAGVAQHAILISKREVVVQVHGTRGHQRALHIRAVRHTTSTRSLERPTNLRRSTSASPSRGKTCGLTRVSAPFHHYCLALSASTTACYRSSLSTHFSLSPSTVAACAWYWWSLSLDSCAHCCFVSSCNAR